MEKKPAKQRRGNQVELKVRGNKTLSVEGRDRILIRGTNWIGDAVMTLPAVAAIRKTWPQAKLSVLAKPWVAEVYRLSPDVDEVIAFADPGRHSGIPGKRRLAGELRQGRFDAAILLQNAIGAAIITWLAGIPIRAGYNSDGRGPLLTHSVRRTWAIRRVHQIDYYLEMVRALGCLPADRVVRLKPEANDADRTEKLMTAFGIHKRAGIPLIGISPGAAYGPAKQWFPERFAAVADQLIGLTGGQVILFGSSGEQPSTHAVTAKACHALIDVAGKTTLQEAVSLMARCDLFLSNDSGLMHVAGALGVPLVALFGSTNPITTAPAGDKSIIIHHPVACGPCLKQVCPAEFSCMTLISVEEVYLAARTLLESPGGKAPPAGEEKTAADSLSREAAIEGR